MADVAPLDLAAENRALSDQLAEALETIDAIRTGDVDAVVVGGPEGQRIFTLDNVDRPYRVIIEQMQEGAVTLARDGLILYCNHQFATLTGNAAPTALVGRQIGEFIEDSAALLQFMELLDHGGAAEMVLRRNGALGLPVNVSVVSLEATGDADLRCAIVTDLSQIKARQAEALRARGRLAVEIAERKRFEDGMTFVLDAADMGSWDLDLATCRIQRSRRHDVIYGYPDGVAQWTLDTALAHFVDEDRDRAAEAFAAAPKTGSVEFEHRIRRAGDGEIRWLHIKGRVLRADGRPVRIAGVVTDVTVRRQLDEQVRQVQKMEAVGQLTGGIAHDFNNLLTIIVGNMDMAGRSLDTEDMTRARRAVGNALKGAERAAVLTQRLLAFSRRTPLEPRVVDINRLVGGMAELLGRSLGETIDLETIHGDGLWPVEADPNQLENALVNLAVNARDAMAGEGRLTIETSNARFDDSDAPSRGDLPPGDYVVIAVTDTGSGMTADVIAKAFDPFFTTKDVGKGTGLGLSMVYGYVRQTGGHVKIRSEPGTGTTICIYLPRSANDEVDADVTATIDAERGMPAETILVVEDDDDVRTFTVESLRELGYRVIEAHDGVSALRLLERQEIPVRLLFTDVVMPGMSGRDLADTARDRHPGLTVLFTSGYARDEIVHGDRLDAGVELLPKPFTFAELAAKIRDVLDKGCSIDADAHGHAVLARDKARRSV